jgi:Rrf2 family transcriptional regulator, cysteine metabolism repressor
MKMSTRGRYSLRVMLELALREGEGPVPVEEIAARQGISGHYIHLLAPALRKAGLVRAARGPRGGYRLSRPPSEISLLEVVEAVEGKTAPVECVADEGFCGQAGGCAAREVWSEVASAVEGVLGGLTLEELAGRQRKRPAAVNWQI